MPLTTRIEYECEDDIILPEKWGYVWENGYLKYKHGSEDKANLEPETRTNNRRTGTVINNRRTGTVNLTGKKKI